MSPYRSHRGRRRMITAWGTCGALVASIFVAVFLCVPTNSWAHYLMQLPAVGFMFPGFALAYLSPDSMQDLVLLVVGCISSPVIGFAVGAGLGAWYRRFHPVASRHDRDRDHEDDEDDATLRPATEEEHELHAPVRQPRRRHSR